MFGPWSRGREAGSFDRPNFRFVTCHPRSERHPPARAALTRPKGRRPELRRGFQGRPPTDAGVRQAEGTGLDSSLYLHISAPRSPRWGCTSQDPGGSPRCSPPPIPPRPPRQPSAPTQLRRSPGQIPGARRNVSDAKSQGGAGKSPPVPRSHRDKTTNQLT